MANTNTTAATETYPKSCRQCGNGQTILFKVVRLGTGMRERRAMKGSTKRGLCYDCAGATVKGLNKQVAR